MYCIFCKFQGGYRNIFIPPPPYTKKLFWGGIKSDVTEMIPLLTFQSINNVLYFFKFGWGIEIFFIPPPLTKKIYFLNFRGYRNFFIPHPLTPKNIVFGGGAIKNDVTEMIHLLTFQSINNVWYLFFNFGGGGHRNIFYTPPLTKKFIFKFQGI